MNLPDVPVIYFILLAFLAILALIYIIKKVEKELIFKKREIRQHEFDGAIYGDLTSRIGSNLNLESICETAIASANKLIPVSVSAYQLFSSDKTKIIIRSHLHEKVGKEFVAEIHSHMADFLVEASKVDVKKMQTDENISGEVVDEKLHNLPNSLWIAPLTQRSEVIGVIAVASVRKGLYNGPEMNTFTETISKAILSLTNFSDLVTSEKRHLTLAQDNLEKLHEDFSARLVHELRAPLTVIRGATDMFLGNPNLAQQSEGKEILLTMRHSSEDMLTMVNDLLDVYKIEAGKFQIFKTNNNLIDIIRDRVIFFGQMAKSKSVSLDIKVTDENIPVSFDVERISQVLNNLISNAIKFTQSSGKVEVRATVISSIYDIPWRFPPAQDVSLKNLPACLISISDTGFGIPQDKIPDLFSKFKQLHRVDGQGASGLGLAISKGIIESHGGQIFIESKENEGTTVYFTLPV